MTGYCANIPLECRTIQSFVWVSLLISFIMNISQCMYSHNLRNRYKALQERIPMLNSLLEEIVIESDIPEATISEIPEATMVCEEKI